MYKVYVVSFINPDGRTMHQAAYSTDSIARKEAETTLEIRTPDGTFLWTKDHEDFYYKITPLIINETC